ncbi:MAG: enoyl-CoA hydratase/isomerase family protein [Deltaproteobacteria bacterium]|nr:enoyl-CoA hydratase/isomerase family protein [Deltaproteobacteria bacterium]
MEFENILFEKQGRVATLTINRPDKLNALNLATRREISALLDQVAQDRDVGVLVLTGAGDRSFIAGSDLNEFGRMSPLEAYDFMNTLAQRLYTRFEELDIPVIAMINGLCLGAGCELALACDIRIASDKARFGQPEINLGIMPGGGGTQRLARLVGPGKAKELIFTGDIIDAREASTIGLVNRVVPPYDLKEVVMDLAHKIAGRGAFSLKMAKRAINAGQEVGLTPGLAFEALAEVACFCSPEKEEGMNAFFSKRKPEFHKK